MTNVQMRDKLSDALDYIRAVHMMLTSELVDLDAASTDAIGKVLNGAEDSVTEVKNALDLIGKEIANAA